MVFRDRCCNPLKLKDHFIKKALRLASKALTTQIPTLEGKKICTSCRQTLSGMPTRLLRQIVVEDFDEANIQENVDSTGVSAGE